MAYKHRDIVIAYLDGETIQCQNYEGRWVDVSKFDPQVGIQGFSTNNVEYRIKPKPVLIRHFTFLLSGAYVYTAVKNWSETADKHAQRVEEDSEVMWLDDWHEAPFNKET